MYYSLGDITFQAQIGFNSFSRTSEARYVEHVTIEGKPTLQRLGPKLDTIQITVKLHRNFCIPEDEISKFNVHRLNGEVLSLATGAGDALGIFVIESVGETYESAVDDGSLLSATIAVTLKEWATTDGFTERATAARNAGFAIAGNNPTIVADPIPTATTDSTAMSSTMDLGSSTNQIGTGLKSTLSDSAKEAHERVKAANRLAEMLSGIDTIRTQINAMTGDKYTDTRDMDTALIALRALVVAAQLVVSTEAITPLIERIDIVSTKVAEVRSAAQKLQKFVTSKA